MSIINKFLPFFVVGFLFQSELSSSFSSTSSNPRLMTATTTGTLLQSVDEKRVSGDEDDMSYHRRDVLMQAGTSLFLMASAVSWNARPVAAVADCNKDCTKNCNQVAPGNTAYCQTNCNEYCSQPDRADGLSGSVSSDKGEYGILGGGFGQGTVPKGEDKPPAIKLPGLDFTSEKGKSLIGY